MGIGMENREQSSASPAADPATTRELRIWVRLLSCARIVEKRLRRNFQEQFGTTLPRFDVMAAIERAPEGLNMGALSRALLVSNGNVTSIVRQLVDQGLITYKPDPQDGRSAIVAFTETGRSHFSELALAHRQWVHEALDEFPAEMQEQLLALLVDLRTQLLKDDPI
ncbi:MULTISPECIES: MarR family winged helix-turn-helix transcriptional regulator [unclassified Sphingopyxis]|uniref:MarR family winged helix-turn-helix transcriptional regulator n=1 Tax=unclassified Sphingopyxis TaxID=2614943 RepID=UPI000AF0CE50|nr:MULTISPECIES: MarR family transcriptional regulator [unclassified Sphingopyxis]